jgi:chromosome segregation ATPase
MASYIEEAERLRCTLPLDDLLAEASQLEAEVKAMRKAKEQKVAAARLGQQERNEAEKRINELARKLDESRKIYKILEQEEAHRLSEFEAMVLRRQGARARIDNLHLQFQQKTAQRRNLQKQVKEIEEEHGNSRDSLAEPSADIALIALRREKQRLEDLLRRQCVLDLQRKVEAEVLDSSEESENSRDDVPPDMQAVHYDKVSTLEMAKWELRAARGIAAISA